MKQTLFFSLTILLLFSCKTKSPYGFNDPIPKHDHFSIQSNEVNEKRVINVWLPPIYEESDMALPVLYMPDGGVKEDFPHIANTLSKLLANKNIPPFILVGIENTDRRRDLTGFSETEEDAQYCPLTDGAKKFRAFIASELMPEINKRYRTQNKKGIIGESLAGLFVMETFLQHPETFDFYIAMDPSLWWNDYYLVKQSEQLLAALPNKELKLWFAGSDAKDISIYTNNLAKVLTQKQPQQLSWKYEDEPGEQHHTIFRATKEKAFIWTLNE